MNPNSRPKADAGELHALFRKPNGEKQDDKVHQEVIQKDKFDIYLFHFPHQGTVYPTHFSKGVELWHEKNAQNGESVKNEGKICVPAFFCV